MEKMNRFSSDKSGTNAMEYCILISSIAMAIFTGVALLGTRTYKLYEAALNIFP
jgi:Flp pilus assembly pilin Flp